MAGRLEATSESFVAAGHDHAQDDRLRFGHAKHERSPVFPENPDQKEAHWHQNWQKSPEHQSRKKICRSGAVGHSREKNPIEPADDNRISENNRQKMPKEIAPGKNLHQIFQKLFQKIMHDDVFCFMQVINYLSRQSPRLDFFHKCNMMISRTCQL